MSVNSIMDSHSHNLCAYCLVSQFFFHSLWFFLLFCRFELYLLIHFWRISYFQLWFSKIRINETSKTCVQYEHGYSDHLSKKCVVVRSFVVYFISVYIFSLICFRFQLFPFYFLICLLSLLRVFINELPQNK